MKTEDKPIEVGDYVVFLGDKTRGIVIGLEGDEYVINVPSDHNGGPNTIKASAAAIKRA